MTEDVPHAAPLGGKPSLFTPELARAICLRIMEGESLRSICRDAQMPARSTVYEWMADRKEFAKQYDQARVIQFEAWADEIKDISDASMVGEKTTTEVVGTVKHTKTVTGDNVERSKLQTENRKWLLSRLHHKRYGDRLHQEHSGPNGGPIPVAHVSLTDAERAAQVAALLDAARARAAGSNFGDADDVGAAAGSADDSVPDNS